MAEISRMQPPRLTRQARQRLIDLLSDDQLPGAALMRRLRSMRRLERIHSCSAALHLLAHLQQPEDEAEALFEALLQHREEMDEALERDPGLAVAAIDFLSNVRGLLINPTIVEQEELERTERSAFTDALTRLYNRRYFQRALDVEVRRSSRYGLIVSLMMLDLDAFKPVNDAHGHLLGDLVLKRTGRIIRSLVRESDVACRFGGEEFAVILPETGRAGASAVAERVRAEVERDFGQRPISAQLIPVTISGGVASYPQDGTSPNELIGRADQALYLAKTQGKNRVVTYHAERRRAVRYPLRRESRAQLCSRPQGDERRAHPLNLSEGGALLATRFDYLPSDAVELRLAGYEQHWVVPGRVVRFEPAAADSGRHLVAVVFDEPLPRECLRTQARRHRASPSLPGETL